MTIIGRPRPPFPFSLGATATGLLALALSGHACAAGAEAGALPPRAGGAPSPIKPDPQPPNADTAQVRPGERLSQWLLRQPGGLQMANPGLSWQVHDEELPQRHLKNTLLVQLEDWLRQAGNDRERAERNQLLTFVGRLPVTGRVALNIADPRWLESNPKQDPVLGAGQRLQPSPWPLQTVAVLTPQGTLCHVPHEPGRNVLDYLAACAHAGTDDADWAWLAQPDGRTFRMQVASWNAGPVEEPAPGAWLWAPPRDMSVLDGLSEGMIKFLATQGPSPQMDQRPTATPVQPTSTLQAQKLAALPPVAGPQATPRPASLPRTPTRNPRPLDISANDWGEAGLLQTPSARFEGAGNTRVTFSNVYPYSRLSVMFQPLDWLEGGFRYTSVTNRIYGITDEQSYKDKSIDLRLRLLKETANLPQLALGFRDIGGTGLFSSEYLVASKRWNDFDFSLGIGWGNMANGSGLGNPLRVLDDRFSVRPSDSVGSSGQTGNLNFKSMFRGPAAIFGGVQWRTPWDPLTLKIEYDGNDYQGEPLRNSFRRRSPINVGLSYRVSSNLTVAAGFERGDKVMVGVSLSGNLAEASTPKIFDDPLPPVSPNAPLHPPGWAVTAASIEDQTEWMVTHIAPQNDALHVWVTHALAAYSGVRTQRAVAVLHAAAPERIRRFVLHFSERAIPSHTQVIDRAEWVAQQTQIQTPRQARTAPVTDYPPAPSSSATTQVALGQMAALGRSAEPLPQGANLPPIEGMWARPRDKFDAGFGPSFGAILGGPDAFVLYQLGIQAWAEYRFTERTWLSGTLNYRLHDNYDRFTYTAPSNLPRVRTLQREYVTTSHLTVPNLQLTHVGQMTPELFYSVYGGLLETMYAGVGTEWLYKPRGSRVAFGLDINRVRQRGFKQDFSMRDYEVTTGHASMYWDTGWNGVMVRVSAGQYLAGDRGATLDVSRRFSNGFVIGAYATKTNVSSAQFGEGSFDKGIYFNMPLDVLLPRSSKATIGFNWNPVTRDGGAMLNRTQPLVGITAGDYLRSFNFGPPVDRQQRTGDNLLEFDNSR